MKKNERIQGLIEANNINVAKRRALAQTLNEIRMYLLPDMRELVDQALRENGPS